MIPFLSQAFRLARKQLFHNRIRLTVAIAGIAFADLLMFMQTGFRDGLFRAAVSIHEQFDAELAVIDPSYENMFNAGRFSRRRLFQCLSNPDVESVVPLYIGRTEWKNPKDGRKAQILVMGVDPATPGFMLPEIKGKTALLLRPDNMLFDVCSRPRYGPIPEMFRSHGPVPVVLNNRSAVVAGLYELGKPFDADGDVLMSDEGFFRVFPDRKKGVIDFGLVKVRAGVAAESVKNSLRGMFENDLKVLTKKEFGRVEYDYWNRNAPIGFIFNLGTIMGLIVGIVIVYQVLFTDVAEHLAEYATLKAMGYGNAFLFTVVGIEAIFLAVSGFIPGFLVSLSLFRFTTAATSLPIWMTPPLVTQMLLVTIGMCTLSGAIALFKVAQADPAEVF